MVLRIIRSSCHSQFPVHAHHFGHFVVDAQDAVVVDVGAEGGDFSVGVFDLCAGDAFASPQTTCPIFSLSRNEPITTTECVGRHTPNVVASSQGLACVA